MGRRQLFQSYMTKLSAAMSPQESLGYYVAPPNSLAVRLARRFEIEPTSRHLLLGTIGSGKTTQLLMIQKELKAHPDLLCLYTDAGDSESVGKVRPGLIVAFALRLLVKGGHGGAIQSSSPHWPDIPDFEVSALSGEVRSRSDKKVVLLIDGLDRAHDVNSFVELIRQDVAVLRHVGVGLVLVGPPRSLEGFGSLLADRFDERHLQGPVDVAKDPAGREFLMAVLRQRVDAKLLPDTEADRLVTASGGVLRDLISLAKAAVTETYVMGADSVGPLHVARAIDEFGRALMLGLSPEEVTALRHLKQTGGFVQLKETDLALIASRRVLQYQRDTTEYSVHPTIEPLLAQVAS